MNNTMRRLKKQKIEKKILNKIMLKIMDWTKQCNNIEIKKMRNQRDHIKFRVFPAKSH